MSIAWGQFLLMAGLAILVHVPVQAETTTASAAAAGKSVRGRVERMERGAKVDVHSTPTAMVLASNLPLSRVVMQLQDKSGVPILLRGPVGNKKVTVFAPEPQPLKTILDMIVAGNPGLHLKESAGGYELWDTHAYLEEEQVAKVYALKSAVAIDMERAVRPILTPNSGSVTRDDEQNKIVVYDVPEKQAEAADIIRQLDEKLPVQVFTLRYANAEQVANQLEKFLAVSSRQISADSRTRQVILRAPEPQIQLAAQLVQAFDIPVNGADKMR